MAGSLEPGLLANAEKRLAEAGGPGGDPALGTARRLLVVPNVEHISILCNPAAHAAAVEWLDATFGRQPGALPYTDRRVAWFGLGVLGALLAAATLAPRGVRPARWTSALESVPGVWRRAAALGAGAAAATALLWAAGLAGMNLGGLLGLRVGGYLLLWFAIAGSLACLLLGARPVAPSLRETAAGLLVFAALWLGVGLLGDAVWLPWLLIPKRLVLWPVASLALLPWCWTGGEMGRGGGWSRVGWWLVQSILVVAVLTAAIRLSPELGFLSLILPLFPIILLLHMVPNIPQGGPWTFALSGALFVGWMVLAVFPLQ